ncbi:MAG: M23 family metallopeptidase [Clostridiaceae bacterium]|nr:M23 family metallopeptidase [Clostridiaceae bacterium]
MNNKDGVLAKIVSFAEDKGFYIILMLCVIAIGISGYVLFFIPEAEEVPGIDMGLSTEPGLPSATDIVPDYTPEIPDVTIELEPETSVSNPVSDVPSKSDTVKDDAEQTWLFNKDPSYLMPVTGEIIRSFSMDALVYDKTMGDWRTHNGIDISCAEGERVLAIADGTVEKVYSDPLLGNVIIIAHADEVKSIYCNLATNETMANGTKVKAGDVIGAVGKTMKTESLMESHLHLAITKNGEYIDPMSLKLK